MKHCCNKVIVKTQHHVLLQLHKVTTFVASIVRPSNCWSETRGDRSNLRHIARAIRYWPLLSFTIISPFRALYFHPNQVLRSSLVAKRSSPWHACHCL